jgi:hypothetical protein
MRQRVACLNPQCGAHRDRSLPFTERCFVCGAGDYIAVPPNEADLRTSIEAEIDSAFMYLMYLLQVAAAEQSVPPDATQH